MSWSEILSSQAKWEDQVMLQKTSDFISYSALFGRVSFIDKLKSSSIEDKLFDHINNT